MAVKDGMDHGESLTVIAVRIGPKLVLNLMRHTLSYSKKYLKFSTSISFFCFYMFIISPDRFLQKFLLVFQYLPFGYIHKALRPVPCW